MPRPVPITLCITELDPGGAERALWQICRRLDRTLWDPEVVALGPEAPVAEWLRADGIPVTCLGLHGVTDIVRIGRLVRHLRQSQPKIVLSFLFHANLLTRLAAHRARVPIVLAGIRVAEHRGRWRLWVDRATQRLVDQHVCVSQSVADFSCRHGLDRRRITVIGNGVEFERFANATPLDRDGLQIERDATVFLFAGRLDPQKSPLTAVEAFVAVRQQFPDSYLLLAGQGPLRQRLAAYVSELGLADRVRLLGFRSDLPELMQSCDCLVLPSRWEGEANTVLEALAAGLPVIATAVEGTAELLEQGKFGTLIRPDAPGELAAAMLEFLMAPEAARRRAVSASEQVRIARSWDRIATEYSNLFEFWLRQKELAGSSASQS